MDPLIEVGTIVKSHGFQGAFVVRTQEGKGSALAYLNEIHLGSSPQAAKPYPIQEKAWMPKGWKIKVQSIDSEDQVKTLRGQQIFAKRSELEPLSDNEYYLSDLTGATIIDSTTGKSMGILKSIEFDPHSKPKTRQDRWQIELDGEIISVPATEYFIEKVDTKARIIYMKNLTDLL